MTRPMLTAAVLSLMVNIPARAADAPAPVAAPAAAVTASTVPPKPQATELARLMVTKADWSRAMEALAKDVQGQMQGHPGSKLTFPADFSAKVRAEVDAILPYEDLVGMHAKELSAVYGDAELSDLTTFFKSPLGQKYLKVAPQEGEKVALLTQQRFAQKMPAVMTKLSSGLQHPEPKKADAKPAK